MTNGKTALVAGSTGLIGSHLLNQLLDDPSYSEIVVVTRRPLTIADPKVREELVDFDHLEAAGKKLEADHVFCCLGTTMKKAGSKEAFHRVDYTYVVELARQCAALGAKRCMVVSAMGASKDSTFYYNQVKGEMEYSVSHIDGYEGVYIFRPSLLMGDRQEKRRGERLAQWFSRKFPFVFKGKFAKYRPIEAEKVATAMRFAASSSLKGVCVYENTQIEEEAGQLTAT